MREKVRLRSSGFTLIEVILVVAAVIFLAVFMGPHCAQVHQAPVRSKVSRVRADMRSLATALEAYQQAEGNYPTSRPLASFAERPAKLKKIGGEGFRAIEPGNASVGGITTPVAYITTLYPDPWGSQRWMPYAYWVSPDGKGWVLISPGPDEVFNLDPAALERVYDSGVSGPTEALMGGVGSRGAYTYDPTNGTVSAGDLWRVKQ